MDELLGNPGVTFLFGMLLMAVIVYIGDKKKIIDHSFSFTH